MNAKRIGALCVALLAIAYFVFLVQHICYVAGGSDSSGYLNEARSMARGALRVRVQILDLLHLDPSWTIVFVPLGFITKPHGSMVPSYPPGLPAILAAAGTIAGWERGPFFVGPIAAMACLVLLYAIARQFELPPLLAIAGCAWLAAFPPFILIAIQPVSDVVATFFSLLAVWSAIRARSNPRFAFLAGLAFAAGVAVRPINAFVIVAVVFAMRARRPLLVRAAAGSLPVAIALAWFNAAMYGNPFMTGYGMMALRGSPILWNYGQYWLWGAMMLPVVVPFGLLVAFDRRVAAADRALLVGWFLPFALFYPLFFFDGWWCLRYFLPGIAAMIIGALLLMTHLLRWRVVLGVLVFIILAVPVKWTRHLQVTASAYEQLTYPRAVAMAERMMPKNSILIAGEMSGCYYFYSDRLAVRWESLDNDRFQQLRAYAGNAGLKWYALTLDDNEVARINFAERLQGNWTRISRYRDASLWRLEN